MNSTCYRKEEDLMTKLDIYTFTYFRRDRDIFPLYRHAVSGVGKPDLEIEAR